jgi:hypothetical protein
MDESDLLGKMHELLIGSLRRREQDVLQYLGILAPALGGFALLVYATVWPTTNRPRFDDVKWVFTLGTVGILLLLLLGAMYSLALGYNFRSILLQLAKFENRLGIKSAMLRGWPKSTSAFDKYTCYCTPPALIFVFWSSFVVAILGVLVAATILASDSSVRFIIGMVGGVCVLTAVLWPFYFGCKLRQLVNEEKTAEKNDEWNPVLKV